MRVETVPRAGAHRLLWDYLFDYPVVANRFPCPPGPGPQWRELAGRLGSDPGERRRLAAVLQEYNSSLGAAGAAMEGAARLGEKGTVAVVAGQQPGLFTGPLYTVLKAAACVALSRSLASQGIPAVPVFWLASEDHDWDEVNHIYILDSAYRLIRLEAEVPRTGSPPVASLPLPVNRIELIGALLDTAPATEFAAGVASALNGSSSAGSFAGWCACLLSWLFSKEGLVMYDPTLPAARELALPVMREAVLRNDEVGQAFAQGSLRLAGSGYALQVEKVPDSAHLFILHQGSRVALYRSGANLASRNGEVELSRDQLLTRLEQDPGLASPDVVLRPVVQSAVLPTLAVVAGPGELGYYAQLGEVFEIFGRPMPALWARPPVTLVDAAVARYLDRLGVPPEGVVDPRALKLARAARQETLGGAEISQAFSALRTSIAAGYDDLDRLLRQVDTGLVQLAGGNRSRVLEQVAWLERRAQAGLEQRDQVEARQWSSVEQACFPRGRAQERVLNAFPFLLRYGRAWVELLCDTLLDPLCHHIVYL
ncbi:MAG: bacillithiol biosynthesis cysteine-adding enzyme BshC [Bacillota bacterium]